MPAPERLDIAGQWMRQLRTCAESSDGGNPGAGSSWRAVEFGGRSCTVLRDDARGFCPGRTFPDLLRRSAHLPYGLEIATATVAITASVTSCRSVFLPSLEPRQHRASIDSNHEGFDYTSHLGGHKGPYRLSRTVPGATRQLPSTAPTYVWTLTDLPRLFQPVYN